MDEEGDDPSTRFKISALLLLSCPCNSPDSDFGADINQNEDGHDMYQILLEYSSILLGAGCFALRIRGFRDEIYCLELAAVQFGQ